MATLKQIDANRRNAQFSTGPRTLEGKQSSSQNALQSGIYAEKEVLPFEDAEALKSLITEYHNRFLAITPEARALVDSLIHNDWLLRRLRRAEAAIYHCDCNICTKHYAGKPEAEIISSRITWELKKFDHVQRRINQTERNYHRSLKALQALQLPPHPVKAEELNPSFRSMQHEAPKPASEPAQPEGPKLAVRPAQREGAEPASQSAQPEQLKPDSEPAQPEEPKPTSAKLAPFPQNDFLRDLRVSSVFSVKNAESQTLETIEATPEDTPPSAPVPRHTEPIEPNPCD